MLPCIQLSAKIVSKCSSVSSKIDSIPYIDQHHNKYPVSANGIPKICISQLNMDEIFDMLKSKKTDKTINKYFSIYPQTGLVQIFVPYGEDLFDDLDDVEIVLIKNYDAHNHDVKKEKKLRKLYEKYRNEHGFTFDTDHDFSDGSTIKLVDAIYGYECDEDKSKSKFFDKLKMSDLGDNWIQIGGYPHHLQDGFDFDENEQCILFSLLNGILGVNIALNKKSRGLSIKKPIVDIAYD